MKISIALMQLASEEEKSKNLEKMLNSIKKLPKDVHLIIFPEYIMGYPKGGLTRSFVRKLAEPIDGEFVRELGSAAKERAAWVIFNMFEREGNEVYNATVVLDDEGRFVTKYRKVHLFDVLGFKESDTFDRGKGLTIFDYKGVKFGLAACFDVRFPELFRAMALKGVKVFILPAGWYAGPMKELQWLLMGQARAHENVVFMVGVGNAATPFIGRSYVADPFGIIRLDLGNGERVGIYDIDLEEIDKARRLLPLLDLRRPEVYLQ
jgi:predicted amidohydrolase